MARPKAVIDAALAEKAEAALKALPDSKVCIRLKAIISSARYPISLVSSVFGTDRTTLWRWIKRFASKGIAGLADEPKGHKPPKLGAEPRQQVASWLEEGRNSPRRTHLLDFTETNAGHRDAVRHFFGANRHLGLGAAIGL